ncbi:hypothetical protein BT69DRAFT_1329367 [Atractiella rhizophila]|nr:hypothetical protein BT69DRAFT_1329367 [Atractiella rhizophila]
MGLLSNLIKDIQKQSAIVLSALEKEPHLDEAEVFLEWDIDTPDWKTWTAIQNLITSTRALEATVTPTKFHLFNTAHKIHETFSLGVVAELDVADKIQKLEAASGERGIRIEDLAKECGTTRMKLDPVMSLLTQIHIFTAPEPHKYSNNRHSLGLLTNNPHAPFPAKPYLTAGLFDTSSCGPSLVPMLKSSSTNASVAARDAPFGLAKGQSIWEWWLDPKRTTQEKERVEVGPAWLVTLTMFGVAKDLEWEKIWGDSLVIVDVGTGDAERMSKVGPMYGNSTIKRIILQDIDEKALERCMSTMQEVWADGVANKQVVTHQHDYFQPQPVLTFSASATPAAGNRLPLLTSEEDTVIYFCRAIISDLRDEEVISFFKALYPAFKDREHLGRHKTRLLLNELFPTAGKSSSMPSTEEINFHTGGVGRPISTNVVQDPQPGWILGCHTMERACSTLLGGIQRTRQQVEELLQQAGFRLVRMWEHRAFPMTAEAELA